jgi:hypothetical protein
MAKLERLNQQPANGVQGRKQDARGRHARDAFQLCDFGDVERHEPSAEALGALGAALRITSSDPHVMAFARSLRAVS